MGRNGYRTHASALLALASWCAAVVAGAAERRLETAPAGVPLAASEIEALRAAGVGASVELRALRAVIGAKTRLSLERIDLFAAGARTRLPDGAVVARDPRRFFLGHGGDLGVGLHLDPESGAVGGFVLDQRGSRAIRAWPGEVGGTTLVVEPLAEAPGPEAFECALEHGRQTAPNWVSGPGPIPRRAPEGTAVGFEATVAIDTDNEFLREKFGDDAGAADRWISELFLAVNVIMQRDLGLRILRGDTILRVGSQPDPYADSPRDFLDEFSSLWLDTPLLRGIDRQFAALLSGREIGPNSFSGVAWVNAYCENERRFAGVDFGSFSVNRIGAAEIVDPAFIARGFGHELGHNLGASHTHCERLRPGGGFVDQCFNAEFGCYEGPTACPVGGEIPGAPPETGSLMSYCNFSSASGGPPQPCDSNAFVHPLIGDKLAGLIDANAPRCIRAVAAAQPPSAISTASEVPALAGAELVLAADEPDGDQVTFTITEGPEDGTLGPIGPVARSGSRVFATVRYTPDPHFTGEDRFAFEAGDADGATTGELVLTVLDRLFADGFEPGDG